jgi:molecular chaperone GrpE
MSEAKKIRVVGTDSGETETEASQAPQGVAKPDDAPPEGDSRPPAGDETTDLRAELENRKKEYEETYERLLRVSAEFENFKKRSAREMEELRKFANQSLLKEMLSALDHIELALASARSASAPDPKLVEGLELTLRELLRLFERFHVRPVEAVGKPFNPEFHEAIMREESADQPENTVVRELQKGYTINGRLLRPALVAVAAPPPGPGSEAGD